MKSEKEVREMLERIDEVTDRDNLDDMDPFLQALKWVLGEESKMEEYMASLEQD